MINNSDLIKRLREHVNHRGGPTMESGAWQMMLDAADCLEVSEAAHKTKTHMISELKENIERIEKSRLQIEILFHERNRELSDIRHEIAAAQVFDNVTFLARITALEQALLPFAEDAKLNIDRQDDAYPGCSKHKVKDLRRALELLEEKK